MYQKIVDEILQATKVVITSHKSPDGDSIGSSLGMYHFVKSLGKDVVVCHPDPAPAFLHWVDGTQDIVTIEEHLQEVERYVNEADLIFALDYNGLGRVGDQLGAMIEKSSAKKIMIDHHLNPDDFVDISLSQPEVCSTSQLVYETIVNSSEKEKMNAAIGTPLYLGIMTDTGSFRFPSVTTRTHQILGELIDCGVVHYKVHENTFDNNTVDRLKLRGYATSEKLELLQNGNVALISLTEEELQRFNYQKGDTEGLVNMALSVEGVKAAIFLSEKDGKIKMSFRSKGDVYVNQLASDHFSGGGHKYAAGGISEESMQVTLNKLKQVIPEYID